MDRKKVYPAVFTVIILLAGGISIASYLTTLEYTQTSRLVQFNGVLTQKPQF